MSHHQKLNDYLGDAELNEIARKGRLVAVWTGDPVTGAIRKAIFDDEISIDGESVQVVVIPTGLVDANGEPIWHVFLEGDA